MSLSDTKEFAIEVLDVFDELAKPEIKNIVMGKIWDYVKSYTYKKILRKPDEEINDKLAMIHQKLSKRFKDVDMSMELNLMKEINPTVSIPQVGELAKVQNLTTINKENVKQLYKELYL